MNNTKANNHKKQIVETEIKRKNKQMKKLVQMMKQVKMIKLVIMRLRSVLGSLKN